MKSSSPPYRWTVLLVLTVLGAARGDQASDMFKSLFGNEIQRVKASRGYEDDQKLAADLLGVAEKRSQDTALVEAICRAAYDLSAKTPPGFPTALKAMEMLAQALPAKGPECKEQVLSIRRRQYGVARSADRPAAGNALIDALLSVADDKVAAKDYAAALRLVRQASALANSLRSPRKAEILARVRKLTALDLAWRQIVQMKARLDANPKDELARRRLVELYLVELDDPAGAAKFLEQDSDERLRTYVPLAEKDPQQLAAQACAELAEWYLGFTEKASTNGKITVLVRAQTYYKGFLTKHDKPDLLSTKVTLALEKVEAELKRLDPAPKPTATWRDLLKLVDLKKHAVEGRWLRDGGRVGVEAKGHARIGIPVAPKGDYELKVQFSRVAGNNDVNTILPVGNTSVMVMLSGNNGQASGLSSVNGKYCHENETRTPGQLANNTTHNLYVKVTTKDSMANISATLDGKKLVEWEGPQSALSNSRYWSLPSNRILGLGTDSGSTTIFSSVQLRMLTGKAQRADFVARNRSRDDDDNRGDRRRWWDDHRRSDRDRRPGRRPGGRPRR